MPDHIPRKSAKTVVASADYKSADPAPQTLKKGAADGVSITVTPTLQTGAGNTLTLTVTNADTAAVLGTLVITSATAGTLRLANLADNVRRITLTFVGSGTRTTLTYSTDVVWHNLTHTRSPYWDGTAYVNSEKENA